MSLQRVRTTFEILGAEDPFWAVLTHRNRKRNRWDPDAFFATGQHEIKSTFDYLDKQGLSIQCGQALDFGCGVGRLSQSLADHFKQVVGVDISRTMLETAQQHNRHGERCVYKLNLTGDLAQFKDDSFDFVYSNITLQHMPPEFSARYISEFFRVLRPGGLALFQVPSGLAEHDGTLYGRWRAFRVRYISPIRQHWKAFRGIPVIEMYGTKRSTVEKVIAEGGGEVRDVSSDADAGKGWESYRYCASKRHRKAA